MYNVKSMNFEIFGLSTRDKRIYEALLTRPGSSVRALAEQTGVNRGSVFESIKALQRIGLVSYMLAGERKKYSAEDPEKMHELINERRRELREAHSTVDAYALSVAQTGDLDRVSNFAAFYDGEEGVSNVLRDVLTTCRKLGITEYRVISSPRVSEYMYHNYPHYTRERVKQGLFVRILRQGKPLRGEAEVSERRYLKNQKDTGAYTLIYGNKLATISIDEVNRLSAVIITNEGIAQSYTVVFDQAWQTATTAE